MFLLYFLHVIFLTDIQLFLFLSFQMGNEMNKEGLMERNKEMSKDRNYEDDPEVLNQRKVM